MGLESARYKSGTVSMMSRRRDDDRTDEPEPARLGGLVLEQLELFGRPDTRHDTAPAAVEQLQLDHPPDALDAAPPVTVPRGVAGP